MAYIITTIDEHEADINRLNATQQNRYERIDRGETDMDDCFLSHWAENCSIDYNRQAIRALELGAEHNIDGPAGEFRCFYIGDEEIRLKYVTTKYGGCYVIPEEWQPKLGNRVFLPWNTNGRIFKKYKIETRTEVHPAERYFRTYCAHLCCPMTFDLVRAD